MNKVDEILNEMGGYCYSHGNRNKVKQSLCKLIVEELEELKHIAELERHTTGCGKCNSINDGIDYCISRVKELLK